MALPKPSALGESLVERAAGMAGDADYEDAESDEPTEDDAMKAEFLEMARAIREGDDEAAYEAYKACMGK
jgi:hypothetical protein